MTKVQ